MTNAPRPAVTVPRRSVRAALVVPALVALAACGDGPMFPSDWDLRSRESLTTADAARSATVPRPRGDDRGVISYPGYQVVVARRGDTVRTVAGRIGVGADALASRNAIQPDVALQGGEVLLVPGRVAEPTLASGAAPAAPVDVTAIATTALDRAQGSAQPGAAPAAAPPRPVVQAGTEPLRHRVLRGESAYTIARRYNVPVRALAEWNGLTGDFTVREGQTLLIPPFAETPPPATAVMSAPGSGSPTPTPPSAAR
ncbi:MAG: LysM peptidoglycan-binding domain-containing protein, partial [Gemmobacter sp.]